MRIPRLLATAVAAVVGSTAVVAVTPASATAILKKVAVQNLTVDDTSPVVGEEVLLMGDLTGSAHHTLDIQTRSAGGVWKTVRVLRDYIAFDTTVTFHSAGTRNLRVVSVKGGGFAKAVSRTLTLHVQSATPILTVPPGDGTYVNSDGNTIPDPVHAASPPAGATALCNDGTYSFSQHHSGTCSGHGGVAQWL